MMTCQLARALNTWLDKTVQPKAEALFGSPVAKLHNASSYACRNRYHDAYQPLSEHALANAIDIPEFVLASGERITVLDNWPKNPSLCLSLCQIQFVWPRWEPRCQWPRPPQPIRRLNS